MRKREGIKMNPTRRSNRLMIRPVQLATGKKRKITDDKKDSIHKKSENLSHKKKKKEIHNLKDQDLHDLKDQDLHDLKDQDLHDHDDGVHKDSAKYEIKIKNGNDLVEKGGKTDTQNDMRSDVDKIVESSVTKEESSDKSCEAKIKSNKIKAKSSKNKVKKISETRKSSDSNGCGKKKKTRNTKKKKPTEASSMQESGDTATEPLTDDDEKGDYLICAVCKKKCKNLNGLSKHISHTHSNYCIHCKKFLSKNEELLKHHETHGIFVDEKSGEKKYVCNECDRPFKDMPKLRAHKSSHNPVPIYECDVCHKKLKSEGTLSYHKRTVHGDYADKKYKCEYCDKMFWSGSDMKIHMRIHTNYRPFLCHICSKAFKCCGHLITHQKSIHENRHWLCDVCGEKFKTKKRYNAHGFKTGHIKDAKPPEIDERKWECPECGKSFPRKQDFKIHFRIHTDDRPYKCQDCNKAFRCSNHLKQHRVTHTGEKPWKCKFCEKGFSQLANVNCHMKKCEYKFRRIVAGESEVTLEKLSVESDTKRAVTGVKERKEKVKKNQLVYNKNEMYVTISNENVNTVADPISDELTEEQEAHAVQETIDRMLLDIQASKDQKNDLHPANPEENLITIETQVACTTPGSRTDNVFLESGEILNSTQVIQINEVTINEGSVSVLNVTDDQKLGKPLNQYEILICKPNDCDNTLTGYTFVLDNTSISEENAAVEVISQMQ